jgi:hypothetical protein
LLKHLEAGGTFQHFRVGEIGMSESYDLVMRFEKRKTPASLPETVWMNLEVTLSAVYGMVEWLNLPEQENERISIITAVAMQGLKPNLR